MNIKFMIIKKKRTNKEELAHSSLTNSIYDLWENFELYNFKKVFKDTETPNTELMSWWNIVNQDTQRYYLAVYYYDSDKIASEEATLKEVHISNFDKEGNFKI